MGVRSPKRPYTAAQPLTSGRARRKAFRSASHHSSPEALVVSKKQTIAISMYHKQRQKTTIFLSERLKAFRRVPHEILWRCLVAV